ncbi:MAG: hypothetical protein ACRC6O_13405 [Flavobacterium sp.]
MTKHLSEKTKEELKSFQQFSKEFTAKNYNKTPEKSNEIWKKEVRKFLKKANFCVETMNIIL